MTDCSECERELTPSDHTNGLYGDSMCLDCQEEEYQERLQRYLDNKP